ncbi:unnamed protein product [Scytosiphon promiscuus]
MHTCNFNHEEALRCFEACTEADVGCAMAYWGIAYAGSSNYNNPAGLSSGFDPIQIALKIVQTDKGGSYSELERDLIEAMATRSSAESKAAADPTKMAFGNTPELNKNFSDAMSRLYDKYNSDLDVIALYAESLMVLNPWTMWVKQEVEESAEVTIVPADGNTLVVKDILERAMGLAGGMEHPNILHLYCHLMELSDDPVAAMAAADVLRNRLPLAGHLIHMASHIDIWAGHYKEALAANVAAIAADEATADYTGSVYLGYLFHNIHMAAWAAMFTGQADIAMDMARKLSDMLPPGDETSGVKLMLQGVIPIGAMFLEPYTIIKWHVMIRFGRWDDIIAEPRNEDPALYPTGLTAAHYARGIAFASKGMVSQAEDEQAKYLEGMKNPAMQGRKIHNNFMISDEAPCLLKVGAAMLAGEIEYRKGNFDTAFEHLREAVSLDTGLAYDEPWGWMVPARHALGALLLEQGHTREATEVFRADLQMYPSNMWGLLGLHQCLSKAGDPEAMEVKRQYDRASSLATTKPAATCFCAKAAGARSLVKTGFHTPSVPRGVPPEEAAAARNGWT